MAYYQQPCDSYFVESHDDRERRYNDEIKEREKFAKRHTQLAIAEELSQLASDEYLDDILSHMEDMEVRHLAALRSLAMVMLTPSDSAKLCQMLLRLTSRRRSSGSCARTCLTS